MAYPPDSPPNTRLNTTPTVDNHPSDHNVLADAITDVKSELGEAPRGADANIEARLDRMETDLADYETTLTNYRKRFVAGDALGGSAGNGTTGRAIVFSAERAGRTDWFSEGNTRITPTHAGWYQISAHANQLGTIGAAAGIRVRINDTNKEGSNGVRPSSGFRGYMNVVSTRYFNGTTDYLEIYYYGDQILDDAYVHMQWMNEFGVTETFTESG